ERRVEIVLRQIERQRENAGQRARQRGALRDMRGEEIAEARQHGLFRPARQAGAEIAFLRLARDRLARAREAFFQIARPAVFIRAAEREIAEARLVEEQRLFLRQRQAEESTAALQRLVELGFADAVTGEIEEADIDADAPELARDGFALGRAAAV